MGSKRGAEWTKERTALLTKLWLEKRSASRIAAELGGTTRNAVIGKLSRLGLLERVPLRIPYAGTPYRPLPPNPPTVSILPMTPNGSDIPTAQRRTLLQLTSGVCKWPFGEVGSADFFFCGGTMDGKPYCARHCRVAYRA